MPTRRIQVSRNIARDRISAYECELDVFGKPIGRGRYVTGWYGVFTVERLCNELMPKLAEIRSPRLVLSVPNHLPRA